VLPRIIRFLIVVGFPTCAWLAVVIPNMVNPTGAWVSYGQLLALFATTPVIVGVARALFVARIEPWLHHRRGTDQTVVEETLPLRRHHTKSSTLDSEFEVMEVEVVKDSPPSSRFEEEHDGLFLGAQMVERRSFQIDSSPNTPYFDGRFDYGRPSPGA